MVSSEVQQSNDFLKLLNEGTVFSTFLDKLGVCMVNLQTQSWITEGFWKRFSIEAPFCDSWLALVHPDEKEDIHYNHNRLLSGETDSVKDCYRVSNDGKIWYWILEKRWIWKRDSNGNPEIMIGITEDITEIKNAQAKAERNARICASLNKIIKGVNSSLNLNETVNNILRLIRPLIPYDKAIVHVLHDGFLEPIGGAGFTVDREWQEDRYEYPGENLLTTRTIQERSPWMCEDIERVYPNHPLVISTPAHHSWLGIPLIAKGDVIGHISLSAKDTGTYSNHHIEIADAFANPIAIALENARMHGDTFKLAMEDSLTKLGTRHAFKIQSQFFMERSRRDGKIFAIAMLDLDHFKRINDEFGHLVGDKVLRKISTTTKNLLRNTDLVARYGGEEIIILFPDTTIQLATNSVKRICKIVSELKHPDVGRPVTLSAGISGFFPDKQLSSLEDVINAADKALYQAKAEGRNRIIVSKFSA